jgi:hypothetical protein
MSQSPSQGPNDPTDLNSTNKIQKNLQFRIAHDLDELDSIANSDPLILTLADRPTRRKISDHNKPFSLDDNSDDDDIVLENSDLKKTQQNANFLLAKKISKQKTTTIISGQHDALSVFNSTIEGSDDSDEELLEGEKATKRQRGFVMEAVPGNDQNEFQLKLKKPLDEVFDALGSSNRDAGMTYVQLGDNGNTMQFGTRSEYKTQVEYRLEEEESLLKKKKKKGKKNLSEIGDGKGEQISAREHLHQIDDLFNFLTPLQNTQNISPIDSTGGATTSTNRLIVDGLSQPNAHLGTRADAMTYNQAVAMKNVADNAYNKAYQKASDSNSFLYGVDLDFGDRSNVKAQNGQKSDSVQNNSLLNRLRKQVAGVSSKPTQTNTDFLSSSTDLNILSVNTDRSTHLSSFRSADQKIGKNKEQNNQIITSSKILQDSQSDNNAPLQPTTLPFELNIDHIVDIGMNRIDNQQNQNEDQNEDQNETQSQNKQMKESSPILHALQTHSHSLLQDEILPPLDNDSKTMNDDDTSARNQNDDSILGNKNETDINDRNNTKKNPPDIQSEIKQDSKSQPTTLLLPDIKYEQPIPPPVKIEVSMEDTSDMDFKAKKKLLKRVKQDAKHKARCENKTNRKLEKVELLSKGIPLSTLVKVTPDRSIVTFIKESAKAGLIRYVDVNARSGGGNKTAETKDSDEIEDNDISLDQYDEYGNKLTQKEAFKVQSRAFHGNKQSAEKAQKKNQVFEKAREEAASMIVLPDGTRMKLPQHGAHGRNVKAGYEKIDQQLHVSKEEMKKLQREKLKKFREQR